MQNTKPVMRNKSILDVILMICIENYLKAFTSILSIRLVISNPTLATCLVRESDFTLHFRLIANIPVVLHSQRSTLTVVAYNFSTEIKIVQNMDVTHFKFNSLGNF